MMEKDYKTCVDMNEYQLKTCTWALDTKENNPHDKYRLERPKIFGNVVDYVGNTPMIKINNIPKKEGIKCELLAKCEFFNPGGSIKDRIAQRMVHGMEKEGKLTKGKSTLIEATSGNTGMGLAMVGAAKDYKVLITLPEKMSLEKCDTLKGLGAKIIRTPTEHPCDHFDSHLGTALRMNREIEDSHIPDQYTNPGNSLAHYDGTGQEIWEQCEGKVDYVVMGTGTGGTMTGVSRKLKELNPNIKIVGVDPFGSILAYPDELNKVPEDIVCGNKLEGIGYDFIPKNCDRLAADQWVKCNDKDSFTWARRLIKEEGLLVGGTSGAIMAAAMQIAKDLPADKRIVCIFVDSVRNYISKFLNDDWMIESGFYEQSVIDQDLKAFGDDKLILDIARNMNPSKVVNETTLTSDVLAKFTEFKVTCLPVIDSQTNLLIGIITKHKITGELLTYNLKKDMPIKKAILKDFKKLSVNEPQRFLSKAFTRHQYVVVYDEQSVHWIVESSDMLELMN